MPDDIQTQTTKKRLAETNARLANIAAEIQRLNDEAAVLEAHKLKLKASLP